MTIDEALRAIAEKLSEYAANKDTVDVRISVLINQGNIRDARVIEDRRLKVA